MIKVTVLRLVVKIIIVIMVKISICLFQINVIKLKNLILNHIHVIKVPINNQMDIQMENFLFYNTKFGKFNLMIDLNYLFMEL